MPLVRRNTDTYEGCLRDLQAFLKTSNWSLSIVTRIFFEQFAGVLGTLCVEQTSSGDAAPSFNSSATTSGLRRAATAALAIFKMAKSLVGDLNILAEVSDDIFDSTAHFLNYCLQVCEKSLFFKRSLFCFSFFELNVGVF